MAENTNGITEAIIAKANEDAERILSVAEEYKQAKLEQPKFPTGFLPIPARKQKTRARLSANEERVLPVSSAKKHSPARKRKWWTECSTP